MTSEYFGVSKEILLDEVDNLRKNCHLENFVDYGDSSGGGNEQENIEVDDGIIALSNWVKTYGVPNKATDELLTIINRDFRGTAPTKSSEIHKIKTDADILLEINQPTMNSTRAATEINQLKIIAMLGEITKLIQKK